MFACRLTSISFTSKTTPLLLLINKFTNFNNCVRTMSSKNLKKIISTPHAPQPIGPYSQGVIVGDMAYLSGQIGKNVRTGELIQDTIQAEAHQTFTNIKAVCEAAGATMDDIVKLTIFIMDFKDFAPINETMKEFFTSPYPARSCIQVAQLPLGAKIEVESIVQLPKK